MINPFDSSRDVFDRITRLAGRSFKAMAAVIRFHDAQGRWFQSCYTTAAADLQQGLQSTLTDTVDTILIVPDAQQDSRFADASWVAGSPFARFYAAVPLKTTAGLNIGTLAIIDTSPRRITDEETSILADLAQMAVHEIEVWSASRERGIDRHWPCNRNTLPWDSRELWVSLVESSPDIIIVAEQDGTIRCINQTVGGIVLNDVVGTTLYDYIPRNEHSKLRQCISSVISTGESCSLEVTNSSPDCSTVWYNSRVVPIKRAGQVAGLILVSTDITERKQIKMELIRSKAHLATAQQIAHIGSWELDLLTHELIWSDEVYRIFGFEPQRFPITYQKLLEYVHPDDREQFDAFSTEMGAAVEAIEYCYRIVRSEGDVRVLDTYVIVEKDDAGRAVKLIGTVQDVTKRKQLEEEQQNLILREKNAREQAETASKHVTDILESINDGFYSIDNDWRIIYINDQAGRLVKKRRSELVGRDFWDVFPEALHSPFGTEYRRCMRERVAGVVEAYYPPLEAWFTARIYPSSDGISIFFQDVSEQKLAEQALQESEERFRSMFEQSSVSMAIVDSQHRFLQVNRAFCQLLGYTEAELLALTIEEITHPADWAENSYQRDNSIKKRQAVDIEKRYVCKDGSIVWAHLLGVFIFDDNEQLKYSLAVISDMTGYKEAEAARQGLLRRLVVTQEEERLRISRELHDEMGQYLAALLLGLESLPEQCEMLPEGSRKVQELQHLTRQLLDRARQMALNLRPETLDRLGLSVALQRYVEDWTRRTGIPVEFHSNNTLNQRFPSEIEMTIYRVVQEALTNVLRHAKATQVSLLLEYRNNQVAVIIEDNGRGFDLDVLSASHVPNGNLGLLGMQERVSLVNGTIEIESATGSGTTIFVRIPFKSEADKS